MGYNHCEKLTLCDSIATIYQWQLKMTGDLLIERETKEKQVRAKTKLSGKIISDSPSPGKY